MMDSEAFGSSGEKGARAWKDHEKP